MSDIYSDFIKSSKEKAFDLDHRKKINYNISRYDKAVILGKKQYKDLELARKRAGNIKFKILNELDKYLIEFESNFEKHGGKIIWAQNEKEAVKEILSILKKRKINKVVKTKSMTTEEIELNENLEKKKIESIETDLGEYIVQLAGEKPYHIVTPAMHKSKEDVSELFHEKFKTPIDSTPEEITFFVRQQLRQKFIEAEAGISGANFLIADTGSIALTENEGNGLLSVSFPKLHIVVAGIEKIIPSINDLELFWPLLATFGTGQNITVYNSVISGPKHEFETDGPQEMFVILLDNGRTELLKQKEQRRALSCIRCGACLNACPIYKNIGGYTYGTTYSGPIGSIINPYFKGMKEFKHLSFASSLCGSCTEVCPVNINLHELLLFNRNDAVKRGHTKASDRISMYIWKKTMLKRRRMDTGSNKMKNLMMRILFKKSWGPGRTIPKIHERSFKKQWEEKKGKS
ncbi:MAG: iron-sulfur cluster-binding protein [Bacteroidales bacterium]|nr:iron-sulfur cluster-binding protein [Bacteroidales bacterium]